MVTVNPLPVATVRKGSTTTIIRTVMQEAYDDVINYYGPYTTADAMVLVTAIEERHPDCDVYLEILSNHNPLFSGVRSA